MASPKSNSEVHKRLFLYSHPRTRSNLFMRLLETHPQMVTKQYPFMFAFQAGPEAQWSEEKRALRIQNRKLDVTNSGEADVPLPVPNPTLLPDRLLASMSPIIIIRHPIFTYTSYIRAASVFGGTGIDSEFPLMATYRWQRIIYDFYREYYDKTDLEGRKHWPIVIDGDKLVEDTKGQMEKFCALTGIDETQIQYSWNASNEPVEGVYRAFVGTIKESTGVIKTPKSSEPLNVEEYVEKWTEEFDETVAQRLKEAVEASIEDYEYLFKASI
ncbi:hypothetical protein HHX47_DHR5001061 [Lentinula edodes]|nr:hypothetical protein HHX47_DHR5001061 [Lentinula edodes]